MTAELAGKKAAWAYENDEDFTSLQDLLRMRNEIEETWSRPHGWRGEGRRTMKEPGLPCLLGHIVREVIIRQM
jgi:hypothetical protein